MKHSFKLGLLSAIGAALILGTAFGPSFTAMAQATDNCFGLSADDCALLKAGDSKEARLKLTSFNMAYVLTLSGSGMRGNSGDLSLKGNGPFEFDADIASAMTPGNTKNLDKLTFENIISGTATNKGHTTPFNADIRILNGILYFESDKVTDGQWKSLSLATAVRGLAQNQRRLGGGLGGRGGGNPAKAMEAITAAVKLLQTPGFVSAQRAADTTLENQQIANFVFHFDVTKLFNSPDFITFVKTIGSNNPTISKMSDAQMQAIASQLATAFKDTQFTVTRLVGVTDKLPHGISIDLALNVNPSDLPRMAEAVATPEANPQPIMLNFHLQFTISGIGTKANVTAPAGAQPFNPGGPGGPGGAATPAATS